MFVYPKVKRDNNGIWLKWIAPFQPKYTKGRYAIGTKVSGRNIKRYILAGIGLLVYGRSRKFCK